MVKMHKATFWVKKEDWTRFQSLAAVRNATATDLLRDYISTCIEMRLPEMYEEQVKERLEEALVSEIDSIVIDKLAEKVYELMGNDTKPTETIEAACKMMSGNTDDTDNIYRPCLTLIHNENPDRNLIEDSRYQSYTDDTDDTDTKDTSGSHRSEDEIAIAEEKNSDRQSEGINEKRSPASKTELSSSDRQGESNSLRSDTADTANTAVDAADGSVDLSFLVESERTIADKEHAFDTPDTPHTALIKEDGSVEFIREKTIAEDQDSDRQSEDTNEKRSPEENSGETPSDRQVNYASKKMYLDQDVAKIEGLSRQSVGRYRTGARKPADETFWDRWAEHPTCNKYWAKLA